MIESGRVLLFTAALGILFLPVGTTAQQAEKVPKIGVTAIGSASNPYTDALRRGLADLGWVQGQNIVIEYRYAEGRRELYPAFMADLVRLKVDVIVAGGGEPAVRAAMQATGTIAIVVPLLGAPVTSGLARTLARPAANVTGQSQVEEEINAKRAEFLKAILPNAERVAVLRDSGDPQMAQINVDAVAAAARSLGLRLQVFSASRAEDFDGAFRAAKAAGAEGLIVPASAFFNNHRQRLVDLSGQHRLASRIGASLKLGGCFPMVST